MPKQNLTISLMAGCVTFIGFSSGAASSEPCGDGVKRCACGDTVVESTRLRPSDPVVNTDCDGDGLVIGEDGVTLNCRGLTLRGNGNADDSNEFAGVLASDRERVTVKNCRIENFWDGIRFDDDTTKSTIHNNKTRFNLNDGISLDQGNKILIKGNHSSKNYDDGFDIQRSDDNLILSNRAEKNEDDGFDFDISNDNSIALNTGEHNRDSGLDVGFDNTGNKFKANRFNKNKKDGISSSSESDGNSYLFNTASRNDRFGILIEGNDNQLTGNRGRRNGDIGVNVTGGGDGPNRLRKNVFSRSRSGTDICAEVGPNDDQGGNRVVVDFTGPCPSPDDD